MAYAKTTIGQVLAQVGIGLGCASLYYKSFIHEKSEPALVNLNSDIKEEHSGHQLVASLDIEAQKTTGQIWGLGQPDTGESRQDEQRS